MARESTAVFARSLAAMAATPQVHTVENHAGLSEPEISALSQEVGCFRTLEDLIKNLGRRARLVDVVTQDEYTLDVLVRWDRELFLVFGAT